MEISELKQPYRRMAEYYRIVERSELTGRIEIYIPNEFPEPEFNHWFWTEIKKGNNPPITEEIKKHFPPDFDFSGDVNEKVNLHKELFDAVNVPKEIKEYKMSLFDKENQRKIEDENLQKRIYTQLAKEGKFDQLPDTCEFSEPVELEVTGESGDLSKHFRRITGKFKGNYMDIHCIGWKNVQLPTPEIDFSQFNPGDILEITNKDNEKYYGLLYLQTINELVITLSYNSKSSRHILKDNILSISKLK